MEEEVVSVKTNDFRLKNGNLKQAGITKKEIDRDGQYYYKSDETNDPEAREENFFWSICLCICPTISWK
jgi:membrane associated rhomboid family serine protease